MEQITDLKNILKKGFNISSFMGYKQEKVIVTFQKKKDVLKKRICFFKQKILSYFFKCC